MSKQKSRNQRREEEKFTEAANEYPSDFFEDDLTEESASAEDADQLSAEADALLTEDSAQELPAAADEPEALFGEETVLTVSDLTEAIPTPFTESLDTLPQSAIEPGCPPEPRKIFTAMFFARLLVILLCSGVFGYAVYSIADRLVETVHNDNLMASLNDSLDARSVVARITSIKTNSGTPTLLERLQIGDFVTPEDTPEVDAYGEYDAYYTRLLSLQDENPDILAFIRITGAMQLKYIYPVTHAEDNIFYLDKDYLLNDSKAGAIFSDFRNSTRMKDNYNTVFYGHCMTDGSMFRPIKYWFDSTDRNSTASGITIEIITLDGVYVYDLFAAYRSEGVDFITVSFADETAYVNFLGSLLTKASATGGYNSGKDYNAGSRIITLSTCTNVVSSPDERYVVHGILTKVIKYN